ncbi:uncharacterized protein L969DRAFT_334428 [Mixia osmundae IAM 14324]|uniref:Sulfhydryl oxidase n=1 Tax=Mixia osmundae (strain CBS 9802 / IAM 14324 / JCM 22182 / KY 12970) TaxID=764103 RepID=G7E6B7_MIXOS|nr:uncharacterized protein L969DRAFT_334428 [Mixia osmundae IAM 14324]KEI40467.1 hypothetical protein L969DRAFT_334428 [Mixia osmundae IAM 14324]GAA98377.1 hypothetical protein E5Q_05063 [Mixia osmundae IAM 14324]
MSDVGTSEQHRKGSLPPGMVLGPDGKPCKVCSGFKAWSSVYGAPGGSKGKQKAAKVTSAAAAGAVTAVPLPESSDALPKDCPADVERLGRHTWTFLHTTAAYYPERPSETQQSSMMSLLRAMPVLYPCSHCAADLAIEMKQRPPDVSSRERLARWMCETHNEINVKLGKEAFDCDKVDERWKDGWKDGHCD